MVHVNSRPIDVLIDRHSSKHCNRKASKQPMNDIPHFLRMAGAAVIGLSLMILGGVFAVSLFVAVLLVVSFGVLGALLSGRKPEAFELWSRWRAMRDNSRFSAVFNRAKTADRTESGHARPADVVDVEARDLPN